MTNQQNGTDLYATHAAYDREVERASITLDAMERTLHTGDRVRQWRAAGGDEYVEAERCFFDFYQARSSFDDGVLAMPIERWEHIEQKIAIVRRILEVSPERQGELRRLISKQIAAWKMRHN
jgi:hypothetical protein